MNDSQSRGCGVRDGVGGVWVRCGGGWVVCTLGDSSTVLAEDGRRYEDRKACSRCLCSIHPTKILYFVLVL